MSINMQNRYKSIFTKVLAGVALFSLAFLILIPVARAETVFRYGGEVSVTADQKVNGDLYAFSGQWWTPQAVNVSGLVAGDLYTTGDTITVNGEITEDVTAAGFSVQIHGPVGDDVRVLADKVVIGDEVTGDLFVVAEKLTILSSAKVVGNIYFYGGSAEIAGDVGGSVHGFADKWRIDGSVGQGIDVTAASSLALGDRASITGDVVYKSNTDIVRSAQSAVNGDITRSEMEPITSDESITGALTTTFVIVFACFFFYLLFKRQYNQLAASITRNLIRNFVVGMLALFLTPFIAVFLMVTVLGLAVGLGLLFLYLFALTLAFVSLPVVFGLFVRKFYDKKLRVDIFTLAIGVVGTFLMVIVPFFGQLIMLALISLLMGEVTYRLYDRFKS